MQAIGIVGLAYCPARVRVGETINGPSSEGGWANCSINDLIFVKSFEQADSGVSDFRGVARIFVRGVVIFRGGDDHHFFTFFCP